MLSRDVTILITPLGEHSGSPSPPGCAPFTVEVVDESSDTHAFTGLFAPVDWLIRAASPTGEDLLRNLLAMSMVGAEDDDVGGLVQDAWASDERVVVTWSSGGAWEERLWPADDRSLASRADEGRSLLEASSLGSLLPPAVHRRPVVRM